GLIVLAPDGGGDAITVTPSAAITDGLDVANSIIVNAINVGPNTILGTTAVIDFTNFDVDANGQVIALDGIVTEVVAGTCSDSNFATDTDGTLCIDSSNGRIYYRYGGAWHYSAQTAGFQIPDYETEGIEIGDYVIGRINNELSDGALHGLWETIDLSILLGQGPVNISNGVITEDLDGVSIDVDVFGAVQTVELLAGQQLDLAVLVEQLGVVDEEEQLSTADLLTRVDSLENRLATLENTGTVAGITGQAEEAAVEPDTIIWQDVAVTGLLTVENNADLLGELTVRSDVTLYAQLIVDTINIANALFVHGDTTLFGNLLVEGDVDIKGELSLSDQQAGLATIPRGGKEVEVTYTKPFIKTPLVLASPQVPISQYWIAEQTSAGFIIRTSELADEDISFSWLTLTVEEPKTVLGEALDTDDDGILDIDETDETKTEEQGSEPADNSETK
ncbi:hypothetical protein IH781_03905, partial [Patescibacteria group bacterium]|nr:hypothetical protein [Patescibacteria group bacterium]